jgi:carbonic anhydrase
MDQVVSGVAKFRRSIFPQHRELFAELANGQRPEALFITCADSRIDPNLVTQTRPGDLFIIRNAGNIVPPHTRQAGGVTATIEYGVAVLNVGHIVVCGHTHCGAMGGAIDPESVAELPHVREWLLHSRAAVEIVKERHGCLCPEHIREVIEQNVLVQLQHLRTHPVVAARLAAGRLELHGWIYELETGDVYCHDESTGTFLPIADRYDTLVADAAAPIAAGQD